jgi:hypothetical protein
MTDITIPPAALEAGARAIAESLRTARLTTEAQDGYKPEARAAIAAALAAWPGMSQLAENDSASIREMAALILPLPQEASDE